MIVDSTAIADPVAPSAGQSPAVTAMPSLGPGARDLLERMIRFIDRHLADPALAPTTVAHAHHISVRYLHRLFQSRGRTAAAHIRATRLTACARELTDPALRTRPAAAIAFRYGFRSAAAFNRTFRAAYGVPPGEFRIAERARMRR